MGLYDRDTKRVEHAGLTVRIVPDESPMNPREYENIGTMVCWHKGYMLGDTQPCEEPLDWLLMMAEEVNPDYEDPELHQSKPKDRYNELMEARLEAWQKCAVVLPLYLYDHSGITMRTTPFGDHWDSGQVGLIYVSHEKIRENWELPKDKPIPKEKLILAREAMEEEVKTYDQFLTGDVYGYIVEDEDENELSSCWGYFGIEDALSEGKSAAECEAKKIAKDKEALGMITGETQIM